MIEKIKVYIIVQKGRDYNDSGYDISEYGTPIKAFIDNKLAEQELKKLNIIELARWNDGFENFIDQEPSCFDDDLKAKIIEYGGRFITNRKYKHVRLEFDLSKLTEEQAMNLLELTDSSFYEIQAVELE